MRPWISRNIAVSAALVCLYGLVWGTFTAISHGAVHHDMAEAWAWGKEPAWGYYKHPPASAWLAYAWFSIWPRNSFFFYLLSETNAAIGLLGAWAIAGRLVDCERQIVVLAMLGLTPLYNLFAMKYNANTVLLSLWPWTAYALIRALETQRAAWGAAFGIMAALSMLAKYYSGLLLLSCLAAALLHPNARAFFRSPSPYVAVLTGSALIAPHLVWMPEHDFQTLEYAATLLRHRVLNNLVRGLSASGQALAFHVVAIAALLWSLTPRERGTFVARLLSGARAERNLWVMVLAFGPFALTILALLIVNVRISAQFMIPIFFMVPTALLLVSEIKLDPSRTRDRLARPAILFPLAALAVSPLVAIASFMVGEPTFAEPRIAVVEAATKAWHEAFGTRLDVVAGVDRYAQAATFYSPDAPSDFTAFNFAMAVGVVPERIKRNGLLVICDAGDEGCVDPARPYLTPETRRVLFTTAAKLWWWRKDAQTFQFLLVPPTR